MILPGIFQSGKGFITRWTVAGNEAARTITLPLTDANGSTFDCTIDWGDGTAPSVVTAYDDADRVHTYAADGTYLVTIRGKCEGWSFNNGGDKLKITGILHGGTPGTFGGFRYLANGFYGCALTTLGSGGVRGEMTNLSFCYAVNQITAIPAGHLDHVPLVTNLSACYYNNQITAIPAGHLDHVPLVTNLEDCYNTNKITAIPAGHLDHVPLVTSLYYCYATNQITAIPAGHLDHVPRVTNLFACYNNNQITAIPAGHLDHVPLVTNLSYCYANNPPLQIGAEDMFLLGAEATRFLGKVMKFTSCYERASFTGVQGTAPALWECDYGETITLDVAPAADWIGGDTITGQTSGASALVVAKVSTLVYKIKRHVHNGTDFQLGEVVGVTGDATKLAGQGAANPTFSGTPVSAKCFGGAGNSIASISNYNDIPYNWKN